MQSQPPSAAQPTPQLSAPTTLLVHSLETTFLSSVVAGVLAGYQALQAGLGPAHIIWIVVSVIVALIAKWTQTTILSNAIAKQNALIAVSDLAQHILPMHNIVADLSRSMDTIFQYLGNQAHSLPSQDVLAQVASFAAMVPALKETLTAASTATTLAPAPVQVAIPLDQMATQSVPVAPQAQPFPQGQLPFPVPQGVSWDTAGVPVVSAQ